MIDFTKYDKQIDKKELEEQMRQASDSLITEYPDGEYEVALDQMEIKETRTGKLMVAIRWTIAEGKYTNRKMFQNQIVSGTTNNGLMIHRIMEIFRAMGVEEEECKFTNYTALNELVDAVSEDFRGERYTLTKSTSSNGYSNYTID